MVETLTCLHRLPVGFFYVEPEPLSLAEGVVFTHSFPTNGGGGFGYTGRMVLSALAIMAPTFAPTKIRITLKGGSVEGVSFGKLYVGHKDGNYGFLDPLMITFAGLSNVQIPPGQEVVSDWVPFAWDRITDLLFSFYLDDTMDTPARDTAFDHATYYYIQGDDTTNTSPSGYTEAGCLWDAISKIEMDGV